MNETTDAVTRIRRDPHRVTMRWPLDHPLPPCWLWILQWDDEWGVIGFDEPGLQKQTDV